MRSRALVAALLGSFAACSGVSRDPVGHFRAQGGASAGAVSEGAGQTTGGGESNRGRSGVGTGGFAGDPQEVTSGGRGGPDARAGGTSGLAGESSEAGSAGTDGAGVAGDRAANGGTPSAGGAAGTGATGNTAAGGDSGATGNSEPVSQEALVYWFSGDFGITKIDGAIAEWLDRSGNQAHATQSEAALRPKVDKFPYSSLNAAHFDGQDDHLVLPPLAANFDDGLTFFAIANAASNPACMSMIELSNGSQIDDVGFMRFMHTFAYEVFEKVVSGIPGAFGVGSSLLLDATHRPDEDVSLFLNWFNTGNGISAVPSNVSRSQNFLGRSLHPDCGTWNGVIAEVLLYARPLPTDEQETLRRYLSDKWGCCSG